MEERYILVGFPEIQEFMMDPEWDKCIFCIATENNPCPDSTYAVPEYLYYKYNQRNSVEVPKELLCDILSFIDATKFELGEEFDEDGLEGKLTTLLNQ